MPENREPQPGDGQFCRSIKKLKRIRFKLHSFFRKKDQPPRYRRKVPLRNYHSNHLLLEVSENIWKIYEQVTKFEFDLFQNFKEYAAGIDTLFQVDKDTNQSLIVEQLAAFNKSIEASVKRCNDLSGEASQQIEACLQPAIEKSILNYYKLGTFEGRRDHKKNRFIKKVRRKKNNTIKNILIAWETSLFSLSEDWSFDADLYLVKNRALSALLTITNSSAIKRSMTVAKWFSDAKLRVVDLSASLTSEQLEGNAFLKVLDQVRRKVNSIFQENESSLSNIGQEETIPYAINGMEKQISDEVDGITAKRMIVKGSVAANQMKLSDLAAVYLQDLLQFEILPAFKSVLDQVKKQSTKTIVNYENNIHNLAHVSDYNLDTARTLFLSDEDAVLERAQTIITDGISQFEQKMDQLAMQVETAYKVVLDDATTAVMIFIDELILLTENEKVSELRLRLLKAKALNKTEIIWQQLVSIVLQLFLKLKPLWYKVWTRGSHLTEQLTQIYGDGIVQAQINTDISNFLAETKINLERMPFLYQRLFKLEPIAEGYLFFERAAELNGMQTAFSDWEKGRFSAVAVTGEKGAGITSLIQFFVKHLAYDKKIIPLSHSTQIYRIESFLDLLANELNLSQPVSKETLIEQLNASDERRIIIIEGLQHLYLKKVDGFECLKLLFEVMSKTNKNVFWLTSCTLHTWNYLQKVLSIGEFFGHVITLGEFSNDEMVDIILKRHNVSGYDMKFLPGKADLTNRKLARMPETQLQSILQKQYFSQLNQLAKGNLSVAFIFWMRSIQRIEDNILKVSSMGDFNGDFIKSLAPEKLFCLHAILLHDGLELNEFCKVMRYLPETGRLKLFQMVDDGLLLDIRNRYVVNLLLYRPIINALKAKNLLH